MVSRDAGRVGAYVVAPPQLAFGTALGKEYRPERRRT